MLQNESINVCASETRPRAGEDADRSRSLIVFTSLTSQALRVAYPHKQCGGEIGYFEKPGKLGR